jgi:hypothetical protein
LSQSSTPLLYDDEELTEEDAEAIREARGESAVPWAEA